MARDTSCPSQHIAPRLAVRPAAAGVEDELDRYAGHEVLRAILDQGCDPKEYGRQYEVRLRQAELESIQDYLSESDNLVTLHQQVLHHSLSLKSKACRHLPSTQGASMLTGR